MWVWLLKAADSAYRARSPSDITLALFICFQKRVLHFGFSSDRIKIMPYDTDIDETVSVWAFFDAGIHPIAMNWRRRFVKFEKLIFKGTRRVGGTKLINLVCAGNDATFELEFNSESSIWKLKRVMSGQ